MPQDSIDSNFTRNHSWSHDLYMGHVETQQLQETSTQAGEFIQAEDEI